MSEKTKDHHRVESIPHGTRFLTAAECAEIAKAYGRGNDLDAWKDISEYWRININES
jgi:hypothetical protein